MADQTDPTVTHDTNPSRLSVNINKEVLDGLVDLMDKDDVSATELTRKAYGAYILLRQWQDEGCKILIQSLDGTIEEQKIL